MDNYIDLSVMANVSRLVGYCIPSVQSVSVSLLENGKCRVSCFVPSGMTIVVHIERDKIVSMSIVGYSILRIDLRQASRSRGGMEIAENAIDNSDVLSQLQNREIKNFAHEILRLVGQESTKPVLSL